jgi:hypothetical protein
MADRAGTSRDSGVFKGRGISGRVTRSTGTAMDTTKKANRVPILTISAMAPSGTNAAGTATPAMVNAVVTTGVPRVHTPTYRNGTDCQGAERTERHVTLRVPGLLTEVGDGFEPTVGKENDGSSDEYANHAVRRGLDPGEELPQRRLESAQSFL